jgi:hypothetical protein
MFQNERAAFPGSVRRLASRLVSTCQTTTSNLRATATVRQELGLPPARTKGAGVLAKRDIGDNTFWGINAHGQYVSAWQILRLVNPTTFSHAEGNAFNQAAEAGVVGGNAHLYVDAALCKFCGRHGGVRTGSEYNRVSISAPTWEEVISEIRAMDGQIITNVMLGEPQEGTPDMMPYIAIGGGAGEYFVFVTFDDTRFYSLISSEAAQGTGKLVVGGQMGEFPLREIVDEVTLMKAVQTFFESGALNSDLRWEG